MAACKRYIAPIFDTENIGDSLIKLNNNFVNLRTALCELHERFDTNIMVRTFFYYGPNASTDSTSGMANNQDSRPSNTTIENFVNNSDQLNLIPVSKVNDVVYVIYQKTGYLLQEAVRVQTGTVTVPAPAGFSGSQVVGWTTNAPEKNTFYAPVFITWKLIYINSLETGNIYGLTYDGTSKYYTVPGFPKFTRANTAATSNWNTPQNWGTY